MTDLWKWGGTALWLPLANSHRIRRVSSFSDILGWVPYRPVTHSPIYPYLQNKHITGNSNESFSNSCWQHIFDWNSPSAKAGLNVSVAFLAVISCSCRPSVQEISNQLPKTVVPDNVVHPPPLPPEALAPPRNPPARVSVCVAMVLLLMFPVDRHLSMKN